MGSSSTTQLPWRRWVVARVTPAIDSTVSSISRAQLEQCMPVMPKVYVRVVVMGRFRWLVIGEPDRAGIHPHAAGVAQAASLRSAEVDRLVPCAGERPLHSEARDDGDAGAAAVSVGAEGEIGRYAGCGCESPRRVGGADDVDHEVLGSVGTDGWCRDRWFAAERLL